MFLFGFFGEYLKHGVGPLSSTTVTLTVAVDERPSGSKISYVNESSPTKPVFGV